jgi:hypothetical protein
LTVTFIQDLRVLRLFAFNRLTPIVVTQKSCHKNAVLILVIIANKIKDLMRYKKYKMYYEIVSNVKNMTLGRFWSLTDYDL